jgi:hypothetical protein
MRRLLVPLLLLAALPASAKPPIWDKRIDSAKRFKVLKALDSEAVLDQETGVVWARQRSNSASWNLAFGQCTNESIGGRGGWRLPTVYELRALILPTGGGVLPEGHPFDVTADLYWSSTATPGAGSDNAYVGDIDGSDTSIFIRDKTESLGVWCVRGGIGTDDDAL